ncbi:MAG: hypothetical protein QOI51_218, partial [Nocardioidaceae bacterium]|nr:hypothetical protein [Nocardioidaceae bacterium]
ARMPWEGVATSPVRFLVPREMTDRLANDG